MKSAPGTYALILRSHAASSIQVGRWGRLEIEPGYYIYVGSAFGPGGVKARVTRHFQGPKSKHWHIDYLGGRMRPLGAWCCYEKGKLEHRWASTFSKMAGMSWVEGFGCSDCRCGSHLFLSHTEPDPARLENRLALDWGKEFDLYCISADNR